MSPIPNSLTFNEQELTVVDHKGQAWLPAQELSTAIGYKQRDGALRVYLRNKDEFTNEMTCAVNLTAQGQEREVRIFSPRGCHLLAMLAKTDKAKQFRTWVLDVLENQKNEDYQQKKKLPPYDLNDLPETNHNGQRIMPPIHNEQPDVPVQYFIIKQQQGKPAETHELDSIMLRELVNTQSEYGLIPNSMLNALVTSLGDAMDKSTRMIQFAQAKIAGES